MVAEFKTALRMELLDERDKPIYKVLTPFAFLSDEANTFVVVPEGFVTDLASVPRIPIAWWLTGGTNNRGAVLHDWLYSPKCKDDITRAQADAIFREAGLLSGIPAWRADIMWLAVRAAGGKFWKAR